MDLIAEPKKPRELSKIDTEVAVAKQVQLHVRENLCEPLQCFEQPVMAFDRLQCRDANDDSFPLRNAQLASRFCAIARKKTGRIHSVGNHTNVTVFLRNLL